MSSERRGKINLVAGLFHAAGERDIFQNFAGDCGVASDFLIHVAQDHQKLAIGCCVRQFRIINARERKFRGKAAVDERDQHALPERAEFLLRRIRNQHSVVIHGVCERAARGTRACGMYRHR